MSSLGPAITRSDARRIGSLRKLVLITVAILAVLGTVYGAVNGARRSIHAAPPPPQVERATVDR